MNVVKYYKNMCKYLKIGSSRIELQSVDRRSIKGMWIDAFSRYTFWKCEYQEQSLLILSLKEGADSYSPMQSAALASKLQEANQCLVVYYFDALDFNKRERLMAQGVYFIVGEKYVSLPSLFINSRANRKEKATQLSAPAQYLLLYHLQVRSLDGMSARDIETLVPYKYVTITLAMQVLADLQLCTIETNADKTRQLRFVSAGKALLEMALPFLQNPIRKRFYCDAIAIDLPVSGINALSHYSMLAPESMTTVAVEEKEAKLKSDRCPFEGVNPWDGAYCVEQWKYPPIVKDGVVDRISLYLTLKENDDPRVNKEVKQMIEELWS